MAITHACEMCTSRGHALRWHPASELRRVGSLWICFGCYYLYSTDGNPQSSGVWSSAISMADFTRERNQLCLQR